MTVTVVVRWKRNFEITLTLTCSFLGVHNELWMLALVSRFFFGVFPALSAPQNIPNHLLLVIMMQRPYSLPINIMHSRNKKDDYNEITQQSCSRFL